MRIRRALAAAAATAVIAPAALMAAPAAYASTDGGTGSSTTGEQTSGGAEADAGASGGEETSGGGEETDGGTSGGEETSGGGEQSDGGASGGEETDGGTSGGEETSGGGEQSDGGASGGEETDGGTSGGEETSGGGEETDGGTSGGEQEPGEQDECKPADFQASLSGFPDKIVAGSGWKEFQLNLDNRKGENREEVVLGASVLYKEDAEGSYESDLNSKFAQIEYFDGERWDNSLSEGGTIAGALSVGAGEQISFKLRIKISAKAEAGSAVALAFGVYGTDDGCHLSEKWYEFEVLAPGAEPGKVGDVKPQGGKSPVSVKPEGKVGELAQTGSDSKLPMIALAGGAAVALGAGAMFVVRRRKSDASGVAAA